MAVVGSAVATISNVGQGTAATWVSIAWTSDAAGNVSGNALSIPAGTVMAVGFVPGAGAVQPSNLYAVDLKDQNGTSMFDDGAGASIGASLSNSAATHKVPFINGAATTFVRSWLAGAAGGNPYQLTVSAAGASKSGTVNVYLSAEAV